MNKEYYLIINGQQAGPFPKHELPALGLTPSSMVWCAGMADWQQASSVADLADLFAQAPQGCAPSPYGQPAGYGNCPGQPVAYTNWLTWAIVATVLGALFSCIGMVFGIIAIVYANKANNFYATGDTANGASANSTARINTIIALVLTAIGIIGCGAIFLFSDSITSWLS